MTGAIESNVMENPINDSQLFNHSNPASELISTAKQLAALKNFILSAPEVNRARVEFLKEELANGRYEISSAQIAEKMLTGC